MLDFLYCDSVILLLDAAIPEIPNYGKERYITEEIVGTIHEVTGHTYDTIYDLCFTTERVIPVLIQNPRDMIHSTSWSTFFIGGWGLKRAENQHLKEIKTERHRQSSNVSPDELATGNPNPQMRYEDVLSVEIKRDIFFKYNLRFVISGPSDKKRFINFTMGKEQLQEAQQILPKVLKTKLKGKRLSVQNTQ